MAEPWPPLEYYTERWKHLSQFAHERPMKTEPDLFDVTANYHRGNTMSVQANKIAHKFKISNRMKIVEVLQRDRVGVGQTCEQIETITGLSHQTCSARLSELRREGKIKIVGTRKTRSGSPAAIYQST